MYIYLHPPFGFITSLTVIYFFLLYLLVKADGTKKQNLCPKCKEGYIQVKQELPSKEVAYKGDRCDFKHIIIMGLLKEYENNYAANYIPCQECEDGWKKKIHTDIG